MRSRRAIATDHRAIILTLELNAEIQRVAFPPELWPSRS